MTIGLNSMCVMKIKDCPKCKSDMVYLKLHYNIGCGVYIASVICVWCGNRITISDKDKDEAVKKVLELWEDLENGN